MLRNTLINIIKKLHASRFQIVTATGKKYFGSSPLLLDEKYIYMYLFLNCLGVCFIVSREYELKKYKLEIFIT